MGSSPCDGCAAGCCRKFTVTIGGFDAYRLATGLALPMADFAELRWGLEPDGDHRVLLNGKAAPGRRYYRLALQRVPDPDPAYQVRCIFLLSVGERGRCGVYGLRPGICRTYPAFLTDGGRVGSADGKFCPPRAWNVESMDVPYFRRELLYRRRHDLLFDELVDAWNERLLATGGEHVERDFFGFLSTVYGELGRREPSLFDDGAAGDAQLWPLAELKSALDRAVRSIGWRTDETLAKAQPQLGRAVAKKAEEARETSGDAGDISITKLRVARPT